MVFDELTTILYSMDVDQKKLGLLVWVKLVGIDVNTIRVIRA